MAWTTKRSPAREPDANWRANMLIASRVWKNTKLDGYWRSIRRANTLSAQSVAAHQRSGSACRAMILQP